jgi:P27 family predicted phage terminase small subunit
MRGRKPIPNKLKLLTGSKYVRNSPRPRGLRNFYCARWLSPRAKAFWRKYAKKLDQLGLLTELDRPAFEVLCEIYALTCDVWDLLREQGLSTVDERGLVRKNPLFSVYMAAMKEMKAYLCEFGMTPSSRARLDINELEDADDFWREMFFGDN